MTHLWRDVQFGVRHLLKHPGSTAVVVLALAIGIGGNTAIFSVVHATLLEPLPYQDADRLVMVWSKPRPEFRNSTAPADYIDWRNQNTVFAGLHAWTGRTVSLAPVRSPGADPGVRGDAGMDLQPRAEARPRARLRPRGRRGRKGRRRDPEPPPLGGEARGRRFGRGPAPPHRRPAAHGRGRPRQGPRGPYAEPALLPSRLPARAAQPRLPLPARHGAAQAGRDARAGDRGDERHRAPDRRRSSPRPRRGGA